MINEHERLINGRISKNKSIARAFDINPYTHVSSIINDPYYNYLFQDVGNAAIKGAAEGGLKGGLFVGPAAILPGAGLGALYGGGTRLIHHFL